MTYFLGDVGEQTNGVLGRKKVRINDQTRMGGAVKVQ
jgi:hypothetical protein